MKNTLRYLLILLSAGVGIAHGQEHQFTNSDGRTVDAELVKADSTKVWLRLKGGRILPVPLKSLVEEDQLYVNKWIADRLPDLQIKPDFDRGRSNETKKDVTQQSFEMKVSLKNFSPEKDLEESEIIYYLIGRNLADSHKYQVMSRQVREITVPHGQTREVTFDKVHNRYRDENLSGREYRGLGYVLQIRRKRDMRRVYLTSSTAILENGKEAIINLEEKDIVGDTFVKAVKKVERNEPPKEEKKDIITIR